MHWAGDEGEDGLRDHGSGGQEVRQTGQKGETAQVDPGASQGQHAQLVHRRGRADQQKVAQADGATIYQRRSAGYVYFLINFKTNIIYVMYSFLGVSLLTVEQLQTKEMQEKIQEKVQQG